MRSSETSLWGRAPVCPRPDGCRSEERLHNRADKLTKLLSGFRLYSPEASCLDVVRPIIFYQYFSIFCQLL